MEFVVVDARYFKSGRLSAVNFESQFFIEGERAVITHRHCDLHTFEPG